MKDSKKFCFFMLKLGLNCIKISFLSSQYFIQKLLILMRSLFKYIFSLNTANLSFIIMNALGITSSISIVTCILILIDLFYTNQSAWVCIGLLFICATVLASITLKFQKSLTIINTSIIGSALLFVAVDFIVENNLLIDYIHQLFKVNGHIFNIYERQKALLQTSNNGNILSTTTISSIKKLATNTPILESTLQQGNSTINNSALALLQRLYSSANARLCWYTWVVFGSFFVILFFSLLIQFLCTGRNYDHRESWQKREYLKKIKYLTVRRRQSGENVVRQAANAGKRPKCTDNNNQRYNRVE